MMTAQPRHLSDEQKRFFEVFGFLALPGAIRDDVAWIIEDFELAWSRVSHAHDGSQRTIYPGVMAMGTPRLETLFEHPVVVGALDSLLGQGWSHYGGDGNFYAGDTGWHSDCGPDQWQPKTVNRHIKVAFYLDALTRGTGALRVIPGSHHHGDRYATLLEEPGVKDPGGQFGLRGDEVPAMALETTPGDLVLFDHRLKHAAFGGGKRRRMFTLNTFGPIDTPERREAALTIMRHYRDREKAQWSYWLEVDGRWPESRRRHLAGTVELARIAIAECEPAHSA
jgi:hypothetical protein